MDDIYLKNVIEEFKQLHKLAEKAMAQVSDSDFFALLDTESNSVAHIVKHMAGNMHSRWTEFLSSDGEKQSRKRDLEFEIGADDTRQSLMQSWNSGWSCLSEAIRPLHAEDLTREVFIRGEPLTVLAAINRQLTHYASHTGQIIFLARHYAGRNWQSLSIPRGKSDEFNARKGFKS